MKIEFFKNCESIEEIKKQYKKLAFEFHPDLTGEHETMKLINLEYEFLCKNFKPKNTEEINDLSQFKDKIDILINLQGVFIELIGKWLWIGGNTKEHKETLKNNGFLWAKNKQKWFYRSDEYKINNKGKTMNMDEIRSKYGSKIITKNNNYLNN